MRSLVIRLVFLLAGFISLSAAPSFAATVSYPQSFSTGWNLAGNSLNTPIDVKTAFGTQTSITTIWKWDAAGSKWAFYAPSLDTAGTLASYATSKGYSILTTINQGEGYWVNASAPVSLGTASGTSFSLAAANLSPNWNLVATGDDIAPTTFTTNMGNVTTLWAWDNVNSTWYFYAPSLAANNTLASYMLSKSYKDFGTLTIGKGMGFWVNYVGGASTGGSLAYSVGGTLTGLAAGNSISLANNGTDNITLNTDGPFTFPATQTNGVAYKLSIVTPPTNQPCTYTYGSGTVAAANVTALNVICGLLPSGSFTATGILATGRRYHTATLLPSGKVLMTGGFAGVGNSPLASAELYDPATGSWTATGKLTTGRYSHTATLLANGKVLVTGGFGAIYVNGSVASAELYDPATGSWTVTGSLVSPRSIHTATLLSNGKVLVAGGIWGSQTLFGISGTTLASAELYDPATGSWTATGNLGAARFSQSANLLDNGKVLMTGGMSSSPLASAELYDPSTGGWTATGSLTVPRDHHTATMLPSGKVLVTGGCNGFYVVLGSAELYDPATGSWTATGSLTNLRNLHTATLMPSGKVLVAGGEGASQLSSAELYDPASGVWTITGRLAASRWLHTATVLTSGKVLMSGGLVGGANDELYW